MEGIAGDLLQIKDVVEYNMSTLQPLDSNTEGKASTDILRYL